MGIEYEGIPFVHAQEYRNLVEQASRIAILLIAVEESQMNLAKSLVGIKGDHDIYVVPVSSSEAHLVDVIRVPRIRIIENGTIKYDILLNKDDISSLEKSLRSIGLY